MVNALPDRRVSWPDHMMTKWAADRQGGNGYGTTASDRPYPAGGELRALRPARPEQR